MSFLKTKAKKIFELHPKVDVLHLASDGNGFTEENKHRATAHASTLKDKKVTRFEREDKVVIEPTTETLEREVLVEEYKILFETAPGHNWKVSTIADKIKAKKETLANLPVNDSEEVKTKQDEEE